MLNLPKLNFNYNEFNKYIDNKTIYIHYNNYHKLYIDNINSIFKKINFTNYSDILSLIKYIDIFPEKYSTDIRNNLCSHFNHSLYWNILGVSKLYNFYEIYYYINISFKDFTSFKKQFINISSKLFGSGWTWLIYRNKKLYIENTYNQNNPLLKYKYSKIKFGFPILCIDLWEHAYFLKYKYNRNNYIESFFNIINWHYVNSLLKKCIINKYNI